MRKNNQLLVLASLLATGWRRSDATKHRWATLTWLNAVYASNRRRATAALAQSLVSRLPPKSNTGSLLARAGVMPEGNIPSAAERSPDIIFLLLSAGWIARRGFIVAS